MNVGINGFGRIGRQVFRSLQAQYKNQINIVAVNDLGSPKVNAHLLKYDTNYGPYQGTVDATEKSLLVDGKEIAVLSARDPGVIPWSDFDVSLVIESTGFFTDGNDAKKHIQGSVNKVIISAPAKNEDITLVLGVNEEAYNPSNHKVISNASCTTNCVANMVKVLDDYFGVENGLMSTIHSFTNDQKILDQVHSDLRRARAASENIIPTTTGAAAAVGLVLPSLKGKLDGMAFRVPTSTVSITDFVGNLKTKVTVDEINDAYKKESTNRLKGILAFSDEELVSSDFKFNPNSCIIDGLSTMVMQDNCVKVIGWYDNEWGYASRTADLVAFLDS